MEWREHREASELAGDFAVLDLTVDVPSDRERAARSAVTELVVRVAEALRRDDDAYHQVVRLPWEDEPRLEALGPRLQLLGERCELAMGHLPFIGRTLVWLALARQHSLAEAVDPEAADPEAAGEPALLVGRAGARWSATVCVSRGGPAAVFRVLLFIPPEARLRMEGLLARLRSRL